MIPNPEEDFWTRMTQLKQFLRVLFRLNEVPNHIVNPFDVRIMFVADRWSSELLEEISYKTGLELAKITWTIAPQSRRRLNIVMFVSRK